MFNQSLLKSEVLHPLLAAGCPQILLFTFWIIFALLWREVLIGKVPKIVLARYTRNKCILRKNGLRKEDSDSHGRKGNKHWKLLSLSCIISLSYNNQIKTEQKKSLPLPTTAIFLCKNLQELSLLAISLPLIPFSHFSSTYILWAFNTHHTNGSALIYEGYQNPPLFNPKASSRSSRYLTSHQFLTQLSSPTTLTHSLHLATRPHIPLGSVPPPWLLHLHLLLVALCHPDLPILECPKNSITYLLSLIIPWAQTPNFKCNHSIKSHMDLSSPHFSLQYHVNFQWAAQV